ncbi:MAG: hypothetical protein JW990_17635 [Thermoleophilia bacterium]|nr:hypothetical protein [Thermoleophilia bacterium]
MSSWELVYSGYAPGQEKLREALCTLGNGYFATRGAGCEASAGEFHYPGTYQAGGYNRMESDIAGEDNLPAFGRRAQRALRPPRVFAVRRTCSAST